MPLPLEAWDKLALNNTPFSKSKMSKTLLNNLYFENDDLSLASKASMRCPKPLKVGVFEMATTVC